MPAANEETPLITTVVVGQQRPRYSHSTLRRFCTIASTLSILVVAILFLIPIDWTPLGNDDRSSSSNNLLWSSPLPHKSWPQSEGLDYEDLQITLLETPQAEKARQWSQYYTAGPHLAGKNLSQALWTRERWQDWGVSASIVAYDVYINYPAGHRLALLEDKAKSKAGSLEHAADSTGEDDYEVKYECSMQEDTLDLDPSSGLDDRIPTFHGYSANGNVTAQYVYVNFGTYEDFEDLIKANVSLEGKIALAKYGRIFRGLKVKRAEELGMVGVILYTDPQEDGDITEENSYKTYPDGPARNPSSVQRGSAQFLSIAPGDPTTPGYPSKPGVPRLDTSGIIPSIPSVPISYRDALPLLRALNGHGPSASDFNEYWQGGGLAYKNVSYNIGPSPPSLVLNLVNEQDYTINPIWNVIGIINGTLPDEVVILGNHRDAWIAGGAADPNSGSAALNEVIRSFGLALSKGWKPLRTIVFASWDGEEYGLIGSTEWVEEYLPWLSASAIAYLNVDVGCNGPVFSAAAAPLLNKALYEATSLVKSPNQTLPGQTVRDLWDGYIRTMGSGSDFTAFQDFAGIPSADMGFGASDKSPVYHYHSNYDSFHWMDTFGDKDWSYHIAITKVWALMAANLIETPLLPLNTTDYATGLATYLDNIISLAASSPSSSVQDFDFSNITFAISNLREGAIAFDAHAAFLAEQLKTQLPWWKWWQKVKLWYAIRQVNTKYKLLERNFLYAKGLDGRSWFKHVVFAPGLWTGYAGATFPGLVESIEAKEVPAMRRWSGIIKGTVDDALASLA